ncbi:MAG: DUF971 domain-containing protein [Alphaproteobacteria bacterium]|nr:DUF971 domain-containing protein [Alphaproteobacteria bacterium]
MNSEEARYTIKAAHTDDTQLVIDWADGHQSSFHPMWLRHQCECRACGTPLDAVRGLRLHHIPADISPARVSPSPSSVIVTWNGDGHRSEFQARWLRDHCYSKTERTRRKHAPILWDASIAGQEPVADYDVACSSESARLAMLEALRDHGFCRIVNVPADEAHSKQLIELVGPQRQTHFGTYKLANKKAVDNVGDNSDPLDPHQDETYRLSSVGITVFQVLNPSSNGGDSTLVDGFEAARRLRDAAPEDFDLLSKLPITGQRVDLGRNTDGKKRYLVAKMPILKLDYDGDVAGLRLNERQIGPLDLPGEMIGPCYDALRRMFEIVYDPELRLTFPLRAGEGLLFDNHRVLHGRTGFVPEQPPRSVLTSSVDLEEFHSTLRTLEMAAGRQGPLMQYAQGVVS